MGIFGGFIDQVSNYSFGTALVFLPHVLGSAQACTGPLTSWSSIARHAQLMVMFGGANPKNMQVTKGGMGAHAIGQSLAELASAGVKVVNVSPIREDGPTAVAPEWIAIRPGTDTALLLALSHTLIANGLHDEAFLARYCTGFARVCAYVMGERDGHAKDANWAAPITGIPAETIRALARRMAANRTMISASWSLQRADHGEQPYWAVLLLASCLGQIGLPGGGFGFGTAPPPASPNRRRRSARRAWRARPIRSTALFRRRGLRNACCIPASHTTSTDAAVPIPTSSWCIGRAAIRFTITRT
jgi:biotin/methionine sulfoxide reductase